MARFGRGFPIPRRPYYNLAPGPDQTLTCTGIASAEAFGAQSLAALIQPTGIASSEAFGLQLVGGGLIAGNIASAEAFGAHTIAPQPVDVTATGIPSAGAFGSHTILGSVLNPTGIASAQAFGSHTLVPGPVNINPTGIVSGETFGIQFVTAIAVQISDAILIRPKPQVAYELVCVARVPQPSGLPLFIEVDPIDWTGLSYTQELNKPSQLNAGVSIASLTPAVINRLQKLAELASELWLYRNGKLVFAGPWMGYQVQGETLTLNGVGLLGYLNMMVVQDDMVFSGVDQFAIVTALIDQWQNSTYGNFGIDTTNIAPSGVVRDATYLQKELHVVGQRVAELGARENGFNFTVDPSTRRLDLFYPAQGVDRSTGQDAIVFDERNVTSPNIICSCAPGDVASEGFGTGTGDTTVYSTQSNVTLRQQYGRSAIVQTFDGVSEQATLDDHVLGLVNSHSQALLMPGPNVRVTPDSDLNSYDVGDIVSYQLHSRLSVLGAFRLRSRQITVSATGVESVTVAFV